jgi:integrase
MACIRIRKGRYVLDYRDAFGRRRGPTFPLSAEGLRLAEIQKGRVLAQQGKAAACVYDPDIALKDYIPLWLGLADVRVVKSTARNYRSGLRLHVEPLLGRFRVRDLSRARLKLWVAEVSKTSARGSVSLLISIVTSLLEGAREDGIIESNPAKGLGKALGLSNRDRADDDEIHALDAAQLEAFRAAVRPDFHLAVMVYSYTGLRLAEGMGLQIPDIDLDAAKLLVKRQVAWNDGGGVTPPKTKHSRRRVDLADNLRALLDAELSRRREDAMRTGRSSPWLLFPDMPVPPGKLAHRMAEQLQREVKRAMKAAGLPEYHSIHSLRHTYATLLLQRGESIQYVCDQLGHSSVQITFNTYGRWLPMRPVQGGPNLLSAEKGVDTHGSLRSP